MPKIDPNASRAITRRESVKDVPNYFVRDIKSGAPVEADHVIGDLMMRGDASKVPVPKLRIAYTHLKAYENQRG